MHLVSYKDMLIYKIIGRNRLLHFIGEELTHCVHLLALDAHDRHLNGGYGQEQQQRGPGVYPSRFDLLLSLRNFIDYPLILRAFRRIYPQTSLYKEMKFKG